MVREELIKAATEKFGTRLVRKRNKSMESFYLDDLKKGRGFFWGDFKKMGIKVLEFIFKKLNTYVLQFVKGDMENIR